MSRGQIAGASGVLRSIAHRLAGDDPLPFEGRLASFEGASGWLNGGPVTPESLRGRVVLVDFWTYTCVNWLRTAPYLRAWDAKYREAGLTVVGVHTPEFGFERDVENVAAHVQAFHIEYPVAIDSEYGVWRAFANHFWPAVYIADGQGRIRYHHFGEEAYAQQEMVIQQLLRESGVENVDEDVVMPRADGLEVAADWRTVRSPESYLGYRQARGFAQEDRAVLDEPRTYLAPGPLSLNTWSLAGDWTVAGHAAVSNGPGARLAYRFHARDVNLVMGPVAKGTSIPFRVRLDGEAPGASHGTDLDAEGNGVLDSQGTQQLIRQTGEIVERTFEIEFGSSGAEAYCLTFG